MPPINPLTERFENFGNEIMRRIDAEFRANNSLRPLCERLGLRATAALGDQAEKLQGYIYKYGVSFFLEVMDRNLSGAEVEQLKLLRTQGSTRTGRSSSTGGGKLPAASPPRNTAPANPPPTIAPAVPTRTLAGKPLAPRPLDSVVAKTTSLSSAPIRPPFANAIVETTSQPGVRISRDPATGRRWVETAAYTGWCRRLGEDRRKGPRERREDTEITYKNRRFGRDRRQTIRREEDRERLKSPSR